MVINTQQLNPLEKEIYRKLTAHSRENANLRILEAAELCGCSSSKISKFVKKLGFHNFKQFMAYARGEEAETSPSESEFSRLRHFLDQFDESNITALIEQIHSHGKIILLGLGPSGFCAQYMEYKLRILFPDKLVMAFTDTIAAETFLDADTLVVIFTTSGRFVSFKQLTETALTKGCTPMIVVEEYSPQLIEEYSREKIIFLSDTVQNPRLKAYEKSRVLSFIYIEEVLFYLIREQSEK